MKKFNFWNICKIFCLLLCAAFLLTACGNSGKGDMMHEGCIPEDGSTTCAPADTSQLALSQHSCWQSSLLKLLYKDIGSMTSGVYKALTDEKLLPLIILAFSVWMAWQILKHVSAPTPEAIGEFWTKIIRKAAICIVCGTLASSPANLMYTVNNFIFPVYVTILEFTASILHELVHIIKRTSSICNDMFGSSPWDDEEVFCNAVAGEVLVPRAALFSVAKNYSQYTIDEVDAIANKFSVSSEVIARRLYDTGKRGRAWYEKVSAELAQRFHDERENLKAAVKMGLSDGPKRNMSREAVDRTSTSLCEALLKGYSEGIFDKADISAHIGIGQKHINKFRRQIRNECKLFCQTFLRSEFTISPVIFYI